MKQIVFFLVFICGVKSLAQVGINTTLPGAQLEIRSTNQAAPANTDGLLIPKVDNFTFTNPTTAQQGMMVFLTTTAVFSGNVKTPGFYYWNNATLDWIAVGDNNSRGWNLTGNSGINPVTHFIGSTNNADVIFKRGNLAAGRLSPDNTSFGLQSLPSATGTGLSAFGYGALYNNTAGTQNSAFGHSALISNTTGNVLSAFGYHALFLNTTGAGNSAFGRSTLSSNTTGQGNSGFGNSSLMFSNGNNNSAFGSTSMNANTTGSFNSAFGAYAMSANTSADNNAAFGYYALGNNTTGESNAAFGVFSSSGGTTAMLNASFGAYSLMSNTTGTGNSAFGFSSLGASSSSVCNSAFGCSSLTNNTFGLYNGAFGFQTLQDNTTGNFNTGIGTQALAKNTTGSENDALGVGSMMENTTGTGNVGIGANSLSQNTIGIRNTALGNRALDTNTTGNFNTVIGALADVATVNLTNATAIGAHAQVAASNALILGSINGVNSATASTNVGIGTTAPQTRLDIMDENAIPASGTDGNLLVRTNNPQGIDIGGSITLGGMADDAATVSRNFASIEGRKSSSAAGASSGYLLFKTNSAITLVERMRITATGDIGIGTPTPGGQFELSLNEGRKPGSTVWTVVSDSRLKTVDGSYDKGLNEIIQLQPIRYHYKNNGSRQFEPKVLDAEFSGFIAQEVQPLFPNAVYEDADGFLSFNMHDILVASVNAIKELNQKIESLERDNKQLQWQQQQIDALQKQLQAIESKLSK